MFKISLKTRYFKMLIGLLCITLSFLLVPSEKVYATGGVFTHSYYISKPQWVPMYNLGYNAANLSGLVILDLGVSANTGSTFGVVDYNNQFITSGDMITAVDAYITGYNANTSHTSSVQIAIGTNNGTLGQQGAYWLDSTDTEFSSGRSFAYCANYLNVNATLGLFTNVFVANDMEIGYNSGSFTEAWCQGVNNYGGIYLYDFGDDAGGSNPKSDPKYIWSPSQLYDVSYGLLNDFVLPEIYTQGQINDWIQFKTWCINNGHALNFSGLTSENGADSSFTNAAAYNNFRNATNNNDFLYTHYISWQQ